MSQTEVEFIQRAQAGNADAFGHLYQLHIDAITRFVRRKVGELDEVENLTQIVFMKAWQAIARYQPDKAPFRAWLYRIAGNTVIDHFRTRKDVDDIDAHQWLPDAHALPEDRLLAGERAEAVQRAVDSLRPNYRQVISLRFLEGYDYDEAAQTLDRDVNSVRVTQFRALGALKKVLSSEPVLWLATLATALSLMLGSTVTVAADRSLPGDRLYGVKQSVENARLARTDDAGDVALYLDFADRRLDEASRLLAAGRTDDLTMAVDAYNQEVTLGLVSLTALVYSEPDSELADLVVSRLVTQQTRLAEIGIAGDERTRLPLEQAQTSTEQVRGEVEKLRKAPPPPAQDRAPASNDAQGSAPPVHDEQPARAPARPSVETSARDANQPPAGTDQNMVQPDPQRQPVAIPAPPSTANTENAPAQPQDQIRPANDDRPDRGADDARDHDDDSVSSPVPPDINSVAVRAADPDETRRDARDEPERPDYLGEDGSRPDDRETRPDDDRDQDRDDEDSENPERRDDRDDGRDEPPERDDDWDGDDRRP